MLPSLEAWSNNIQGQYRQDHDLLRSISKKQTALWSTWTSLSPPACLWS